MTQHMKYTSFLFIFGFITHCFSAVEQHLLEDVLGSLDGLPQVMRGSILRGVFDGVVGSALRGPEAPANKNTFSTAPRPPQRMQGTEVNPLPRWEIWDKPNPPAVIYRPPSPPLSPPEESRLAAISAVRQPSFLELPPELESGFIQRMPPEIDPFLPLLEDIQRDVKGIDAPTIDIPNTSVDFFENFELDVQIQIPDLYMKIPERERDKVVDRCAYPMMPE